MLSRVMFYFRDELDVGLLRLEVWSMEKRDSGDTVYVMLMSPYSNLPYLDLFIIYTELLVYFFANGTKTGIVAFAYPLKSISSSPAPFSALL